jgi:predicted MFS family arabinose efflux permease
MMMDDSGRQDLIAFPAKRVLMVLTLFLFVNYVDRYALSILLEPIKRDLDLSDTQIGLLTGAAFALIYSKLALPVARLAEHRNRMHVLLGAVLIWSVGTALCGVAGSFVGFFMARMLVGTGESGAIPPAHAMVGDAFTIERRGMALAILSFGGALGTALAPLIAGQLEQQIGWRDTFLVLGALGLPVGLLLLALVKDPPRGLSEGLADAVNPPPPMMVVMRRLLRRPAFALLIPAMVALGLAEYSLFLWLPSYLVRMFGHSPAQVGTALSLYQGVPLLVGTLLGGLLSDRLVTRDRRWLAWLPSIACALVAGSAACVFLAHDYQLALLLLILPSTACGLYLAPAYAAIQALAGARSRATASAMLTFAVNLLGLGLGPLLVGGTSDLLYARFGADSLRYAFFLVPILYGVATLLFLLSARFVLEGIDEADADGRRD